LTVFTLGSWDRPIASYCAEGDDALEALTPYYQCLVEAVVPLLVDDGLAKRAWGWAKEGLDKKPLPATHVDWESRWRNFVGDVWQLAIDHYRRTAPVIRKGQKAAPTLALRGRASPPPPPPRGFEI
jgi:hypothetical protein